MKPTTLDHSLEIYIPTQCRCGKPLPEQARAEILDEVKATLAGWFGGNSAKKLDPRVERIEGSWVLDDGNLAKEPVDVVQSFTDEDTLIDRRDEFTAYVAQLANRLTQEQMLCRIDGKSILYPSSADPKPHRCAGGVASATTPKPRESGDKERMLTLQAGLQRLGSVNDVRDLFCNVLHYDYESGIVPTTQWPDNVKQCLASGAAPQIIADQNGFKIIYLQLADGSLRKSQERQLVQRLIKDNPGMRGLIVVSDVAQKHWNLVNVKFDRDGKKTNNVLLRRMRVGPGQPVRTAVERLAQVDIETLGEKITAAELQDLHDKAFDVEAVTKQFFSDVANWYFWALKNAQFPKDAPKEADGHDHVSLIRLITRLIFCWFLREKGLLPDTLFDRRQLNGILTGFAPDKARNKDSVYYRAILQNLFFATLSTETDKRKWATDEKNFMAHSLYRFKECFQKPATALNLFKSIPFLNGGLFECLDKDLGEGHRPRYIRIDGFSRRPDSQPVVPDFLFFGPEKEIDLSEEYGDRRFRNVRVRGLIDTLRHYNFTIEENTPIEEEVALDPELCGKVFENLLAAYNPETGTTARKQSGSFYTPREIVNYMVDEALIASLATKLEAAVPNAKDIEPRLRHLFAYNDEPQQFDKKETKALIAAIDNLKTLDPAVGSGAFPMGLLHKLVFILGKLDKNNEEWKERQIARVRDAIKVAEKIEDDTVRSRTIEDLEAQIANVEESFARNELDYGRKLYLIENCIYGVDIQPIAVQIAKMRFFISLIVDQKIDDALPNRGVRPLPNLETKFVAANTLIGIDRPGQQMLRNREIDEKEAELRKVRERHFLARTPKQKAKCRDEDARLRGEIAGMLKDDGWDTATARKLAAWDPYNQNASADFFDAEWMFGMTDGFAVVVGNPPYIQLQANGGELADLYGNLGYETFGRTSDIYCLFYELGFKLLKQKGYLCYITSNQWMRTAYGAKLRKFFCLKTFPIKLLDMGEGVFEATTNTNILLLGKLEPEQKVQAACLKDRRLLCSNEELQWIELVISEDAWTVASQEDFEIMGKIRKRGKPLKDWDIQINYGIKTGFNQGFIIEGNARRNIISSDQKSKSLIKPLLRGQDIKRYKIIPEDLWLINTHNGYAGVAAIDIKSYPAIKAHLDKVEKQRESGALGDKAKKSKGLLSRDDQGKTPYNLRNCAYIPEFEKEKITWGNLAQSAQFALVDAGVYISAPSPLITPANRYLLAVLNSRLGDYFIRSLGVIRSGGFFEYKPMFVEQLPVPLITKEQQKPFVELVTKIVELKKTNPNADTTALECEIDRQVYALYGLTKDEIKIVEEATA